MIQKVIFSKQQCTFCLLLGVNCSETVPNVANAMYTIYSTSYRGVVVYQCDIGHVLSGYPVSVCQEDGTWTVPGVTCIGIYITSTGMVLKYNRLIE